MRLMWISTWKWQMQWASIWWWLFVHHIHNCCGWYWYRWSNDVAASSTTLNWWCKFMLWWYTSDISYCCMFRWLHGCIYIWCIHWCVDLRWCYCWRIRWDPLMQQYLNHLDTKQRYQNQPSNNGRYLSETYQWEGDDSWAEYWQVWYLDGRVGFHAHKPDIPKLHVSIAKYTTQV